MSVIPALDERIRSRHLLDHTFYQRWTAGTLTRGELQEYARQYWHYALAFPTFISAMHAQCDDIGTRQLLLENLVEEERGPENHPELWLRFCESLGLDRDAVRNGAANDATRTLIATMRSLAREGALHQGLAALYAYESQIPAVAKAKLQGLAERYGISAERDVAFFAVHMEADVVHSETSRALLTSLCDSDTKAQQAQDATQRTLDALYRFLDSVTA
ncbi:MAG TPA: CADD family putative folate metabolism protein [Thermoanaerobaculia bacterium]|jgi:pyrroloquinoline-quinone synthase|nr:CADD family putative folate metabolism protein [Thermoanaerobaculia bacterium]